MMPLATIGKRTFSIGGLSPLKSIESPQTDRKTRRSELESKIGISRKPIAYVGDKDQTGTTIQSRFLLNTPSQSLRTDTLEEKATCIFSLLVCHV